MRFNISVFLSTASLVVCWGIRVWSVPHPQSEMIMVISRTQPSVWLLQMRTQEDREAQSGTNSMSAGGEHSVLGSRGSNSSVVSGGRGRGRGSNQKTGQGEDHEVSSPLKNARGRGRGRSTQGRGKGHLDTTERDLLLGKGTKLRRREYIAMSYVPTRWL
jgi:hypothetical protein